MIHFYDDAGNVIEKHEHAGDFNEWWVLGSLLIAAIVRARCICNAVVTVYFSQLPQLWNPGSFNLWKLTL